MIDICGKRDLDLNSSRTEIIMSEKWINFEEELAFQVCNAVAENVSLYYWNEWKNILLKSSKNEPFLRALNKIDKK